MSTFTLFLVCIQACLIHNAYSQCLAGPGALGLGYGGAGGAYGRGAGLGGALPGGLAAPLAAPGVGYGWGASVAGCGTYGGSGAGNVAVAGELPVGGTTAVTGYVPIVGQVEYGGLLPACGAVTISGNCACGCNCGGPYIY